MAHGRREAFGRKLAVPGWRLRPSGSPAPGVPRGAVVGSGFPWDVSVTGCRSLRPCVPRSSPGAGPPPPALATPPPSWPAGSRALEVPGASRRSGKAVVGACPASSLWAQLGGRRPFPFPARRGTPSPSFLSPPRAWRLLGAWKAVGAPGLPTARLCSSCSERGAEKVRVHQDAQHAAPLHPHLCPQGLKLPRTQRFPLPQPQIFDSVSTPTPGTISWGPAVHCERRDPVGKLCYDSWRRICWGKRAAPAGRREGGRTGGGEVGAAPGGGWRLAQGGGKCEAGAPTALKAVRGGSAGGSNCTVVMATEALPNTARKVGGAGHAGHTRPVWAQTGARPREGEEGTREGWH